MMLEKRWQWRLSGYSTILDEKAKEKLLDR